MSVIESESHDVVQIERVIIITEARHVRDVTAVELLQDRRHVPLVWPAGRRRRGVPHGLRGRGAPRRGKAAQHLLLLAAGLQLQGPRQHRGGVLVSGGGCGSAGRGRAGVGREADEAGPRVVEVIGDAAGRVHDERRDGGGRVPAGVDADVGDRVDVQVVVAALHLPQRHALLVVLVRAPEVGPAPSIKPWTEISNSPKKGSYGWLAYLVVY